MPIETRFGPFVILNVCNEILSRMVELWMKNHLVSDKNCNIERL